MIRIFITTILSLCLLASLQAAASLNSLLKAIAIKQNSTSFYFSETRHMHFLDQPLQAHGTLRFIKPDTLIQTTITPHYRQLIIKQNHLTLTTQSGTRTIKLSDYPNIWAFITTFRALLKGDTPFFKRYFNVQVQTKAQNWQVTLSPKPRVNLRFTHLILTGSQNRISKITLQYQNGDTLTQRYQSGTRT